MTLNNRLRLLRLAKFLDRWAFKIRRYVDSVTPKRTRKAT